MSGSLASAFISVAFFIAFFHEGSSLRCHACQSKKSWNDCLKNSREITCFLPGHRTQPKWGCLTVHTSRLGKNNQQFDTFAKTCLPEYLCDSEKCRRDFIQPKELNTTKASYCDVQCCFEDGCNYGTTMSKAGGGLPSRFVYVMAFIIAWGSIAQ